MLERLTLAQAMAGLSRRDFSAPELIAALLARIETTNPRLNAYCHWDPGAAAEPKAASGLLAGLPFVLKDNMALAGTPCACASAILAGYVPPYDSTVAGRLKAAGGSYLGKTNMDEFAMGSSTEHSIYGPAHNPWDLSRTAGGSSGGSAAAVAADLALFALGSDTGGSIRQPAALCGVVGIKPSYGRVSRHGLVAHASSLDQIGPLCKDVQDAALILEIIMGADPLDATTLRAPLPALAGETQRSVKGLRAGVLADPALKDLAGSVGEVFENSVAALVEEGAERVDVLLPHLAYATACYYLLATAEASSNLARYDGLRYGLRVGDEAGYPALYSRTRSAGFGTEVKRRILLGTFALSSGYYDEYYVKAQKLRTLMRGDFEEAFRRCDFLVMPATPTPAFRLGEKLDDPLAMYLNDLFTLPANLAGLPAASVPCGLAGDLPLGTQVCGRPLDEAMVIRAAAALERAFPFGARRREGIARSLARGGGA